MIGLRIQLDDKINYNYYYLKQCYNMLDECRNIKDDNIKLEIVTRIIIETAMIRAYKKTGITNTGAICKMYDDGYISMNNRELTDSIRTIRDSMVHISITDVNVDKSILEENISNLTKQTFIEYLEDLFGEDIDFNKQKMGEIYEILCDILEIQPSIDVGDFPIPDFNSLYI